MANAKLTGDWKGAGIILQRLSASVSPIAEARLHEDGKIVLKRLVQHIDRQDLNWTPLAQRTIEAKNSEKIYIETGWLKDNLVVRRLKNNPRGSTIFIGASPWKRHQPSGEKFSDIMIWLEYGTDKIPARPLIRPTWAELEKELKDNWRGMIRELIRGWRI